MLLGQYHAKVEAKNRIALPAKFRINADRFILTYGFENSLLIVAEHKWDEFVGKWENESFLTPEVRDTELFLFGGATEISLDKQGRFVLPAYLKEFASIKQDAVFVGVRNYIRLWSKENWESYQELLKLQISEKARQLGERLNKKT